MINVSSAFKNRMKESRDFKSYAQISFADGTSVTLGASEFLAQNSSLSDGGEVSSFPLGVAVSKIAQFEILNDEQQYAGKDFFGAKIRLYLDFVTDDEGTSERIEKGTYTVITPETYGETVIITAYDDMYKADRDYSTKLEFPQPAGEVLRDICTTCGITLGSTSFLHDDFIIETKPEGKAREIIGYIAMIACGNARIDRRNSLQIMSYDLSGWDSGTACHILNEFTAPKIDYNDTMITGFKAVIPGEGEEGDTEIIEGTDDYCVTIENPLITGHEQTVLSWLFETIGNVPFRPFSGDAIANPLVEFMDLCKVQDRRGNQHKSFVSDVVFAMPGYTTIKNSTPSMQRSALTYTTGGTKIEQKARQLVERERTAREQAIEALAGKLADSSGLYITVEEHPDKSSIYYMHNKPTLEESDIVWKLTAEAFGISTDGGKTYPYGFTVTGEMITRLLYAEGIDADYIKTGSIVAKDAEGNIVFSVNVETGDVIISGDSIRIGGKSATQALNDNLKESKDYADGKLSDYAEAVTKDFANIQRQLDGQIVTFFEDYEPTMDNEPASKWTTEDERLSHEGDIFYWEKEDGTSYAYRFMKDSATGKWNWNLIQDTDITKALADAAHAQDTADGKRRNFLRQPTPPYDEGDLWTDGDDVLTCVVPRAAGAEFVASDWQKLNKYTDDTVANQALDEARKSKNLQMILTNEYEGIPTDYQGQYEGTLNVQTGVAVYYGQTEVTAECKYSFAKSSGVTGAWASGTKTYTITALSTDTGWVDITADYLTLFQATKRFNVAKNKGGTPGEKGEQGEQGEPGKDGKDGAPGVGITGTTVTYAKSTNGTTPPESGWGEDIPPTSPGEYLWVKTVTTLSNGRSVTSYSVSRNGSNGAAGAAGRGISSTEISYAKSTNGTTAPLEGWQGTIPSLAAGEYLWTRTIITYTDKQTSTLYSVGRSGTNGSNGAKGDRGAAGRGIKSITNWYLATASGTGVTSGTAGWTTTIQTIDATKKYLWNYEVVAYDDSTNTTTTPVIIGVYGDKGNPGSNGTNGAAGRGITGIVEHYLASADASGITTKSTGWTETIQNTDTTKRYLWNYETIKYTDNTSSDTTPKIIGTHGATGATGAKGDPGKDGANGKDGTNGTNAYTHIRYSASADGTGFVATPSATTVYIGVYNGTSPTAPADKSAYTWSKYKGDKGDKGDVGKTGNGINSITYYYATSTTQTAPAAASITATTIPTLTATNKYLWQKEVIDFTDTTVADKTTVILLAVYGDKGAKGDTGDTGAQGTQGINLALKSDVTYTNTKYPTASYTLTEAIQLNETYTVTVWGTLGTGKTAFQPFVGGPNNTFGSCQKIADGVHKVTGKITSWYDNSSQSNANKIHIFPILNSVTGVNSTVYKVKVEKGSVTNPVWTPAPQDLRGENGTSVTITSTSITYQASPSGTAIPSGNWSASVPDVALGQYLWTKTVVNYSDGKSTTAYSVAYKGTNGANGANGKDGRGIKTTVIEYQKHTSGTAAPTGAWSKTIPSVAAGEYLWTRVVYTYTDGSTDTVYTVSMMGQRGLQGLQGPQGAQGIPGTQGINLALGSGTQYSNTLYPTHVYTLSEPIALNETYTVTVWGSLGTGKTAFQPFVGGPYNTFGSCQKIADGVHKVTGKITSWYDNSSQSNANKIHIFPMLNSVTGVNSTVYKVKVEKGSVTNPVWTPAPQDLVGPQGPQGVPGQNGTNGQTSYFHIKYSAYAKPTAAQMTETPSEYIGTYVDFIQADSTDPNKYTWSRFQGLQGTKGDQGIPGNNGSNGLTSYLHIKYSNDGGATLTANSGETVGDWIGQYVDYTQADSTDVKKYTWSKIKGNTGAKGDKGDKGDNGSAGRTYFIELTANALKRGANNAITPTTLTASAYYRDGTSASRTAYAGRWIVATSTNGTDFTAQTTSTANEATKAYTVGSLAASVVAVRFTLYAAGSTTTALDMQTVPILLDVANLTHDQIFSLLTDNGKLKGIYQEGNELYINATYIKSGTLSADRIGAGTITATHLATDSVTAAKIAAEAVNTSELAAGAVTAAKIAANTITASEIAANAVNTSELAAGAVTTAKIAAGAVTATEISSGAITSGKIAAGAVTAEKLSVTSLSAITANLGAVKLGGSNNTNGVMNIYNSSGTQVGTLSNAGLTFSATTADFLCISLATNSGMDYIRMYPTYFSFGSKDNFTMQMTPAQMQFKFSTTTATLSAGNLNLSGTTFSTSSISTSGNYQFNSAGTLMITSKNAMSIENNSTNALSITSSGPMSLKAQSYSIVLTSAMIMLSGSTYINSKQIVDFPSSRTTSTSTGGANFQENIVWASGRRDLYIRKSVSNLSMLASGSIYYTNAGSITSYYGGSFTQIDGVDVSFVNNNGNAWAWLQGVSTSKIDIIYLGRGTNTAQTGTVYIHIRGS